MSDRKFRVRRGIQADGDSEINGDLNVEGSINADEVVATKPMILVNLTTAQRNALSGVVNGMMIYNTTEHEVQVRVDGTWEVLTIVT